MTMISYPSPNFNARPDGQAIDMLVLHYTGMQTGQEALERLADPTFEVSAHYLVEEDGRIFQLVDEAQRAWHAGVAFWRGDTSINSRSIGIEIVNPGHEWGYRAFPEAQIAAVIALSQAILARHPIPARNVVAHSDVAPARKEDPGELFPWKRLAEEGVGLWPEPGTSDKPLPEMLTQWGYDTTDLPKALMAFQRHFCPNVMSGEANPQTATMLAGLLSAAGCE